MDMLTCIRIEPNNLILSLGYDKDVICIDEL